MVLAVVDRPVPASTGTRPPAHSTALRSKASYSPSYNAAASPLEPATTSAWVPAASCASNRRRHASMSISLAAVNGVASAVLLPERCQGIELDANAAGAVDAFTTGARVGGKCPAILLAAWNQRQVCWPRTTGPDGTAPLVQTPIARTPP